ncbi:Animal haem peroxidase [Syntrophus gentianae]|uniref:Animal haem peroxidase n=1 Tax=Syntrophus gentianae TaxID=43775 RepID=A0A1H7VT80_9BACT|nr:peroxidase family protein [Syntrophus gentianae]SEM12079.1 Animal haem peroxidase [Syntrophus gentianae]
MKREMFLGVAAILLLLTGCTSSIQELKSCAELVNSGFRPVARERTERFLGKVQENTAECRGGEKAVRFRSTPYVDWANYWATADSSSFYPGTTTIGGHLGPNGRGIDGALLDLEYQRMELIKFNLFDNSGTYEEYIKGRNGVAGPALKVWNSMRLPKNNPGYEAVGGDGPQLCQGELIRHRTLDGICNDIKNPVMGSTGQPFARNAQFEATFPDLGKDELARNRHGDRLGLLKPDPQVISRTLLTRQQSRPEKCSDGQGLPGYSTEASCDYKKAPFFNVLAAFWIQFMTHDWFSHMEEGHNQPGVMMPVGCTHKLVGNGEKPLTPEEIAKLGCRPDDRIDRAYIAEDKDPASFSFLGKKDLARAYKTTQNTVTAWWDASQIYGYDSTSRQRVKRVPVDSAKLLLTPIGQRPGNGEKLGYLPVFQSSDPINPQWTGQEATAFPDNWSIGMSFYHNLFAREHNLFVEAFRKQAAATPDADSGLRNPLRPDEMIRYKDVSNEELFEVARLVVSAEIAKIHTIEWTPQLLYDEPLYLGMNSNWHGLFRDKDLVSAALEKIVVNNFGKSEDSKKANLWYSVFASGPGIFGLGNKVYRDDAVFAKYDPRKTDIWSLKNPDHVNGGINHFGSPFNFPEEFITVYRLHALVPDLIEYREWNRDPNVIRNKIPVVETFRGKATQAMEERGLANWALSMGRQRLGLLTLQNHPQFLQNLTLPRLSSATKKIDIAALDLIRDRERGVPRFNEFRRQYGLKTLTSFDDFIDQRLSKDSPARAEQERLVGLLREVYGQHKCDASKIITSAQLNDDGSPINDCLGHPNGSMIDNIEDLDTAVGWLSEFTRPHGFAISETQFQVFILNASRRLFSDRFFTSSFRPEFYTNLGVAWVNDNGPDGKMMEKDLSNGHEVEVSPLKRVLLRTMPELTPELEHVVNAFDPWARDRDGYYSLQWKPRKGAESDNAFSNP